MQLSRKEKNFSQFLDAFLKSALTFKYSEEKDNTKTFWISEIIDSET